MPTPSLRLVWSPTALSDLASTWGYLSEHASEAVADTQIRQIDDRCQLLREYPHSGRTRDDLRPGLRAVLVSPYAVFYRLSSDSVEIMHIIHSSRDIATVLSVGG